VPYDGPEVREVDLDLIAITQAAWRDDRLLIGVAPAGERVAGRATSFRVQGLDDPSAWTIDGDAVMRTDGADAVVELTAQQAALAIRRT
jgi:hypothetical protein